ncbi:hypothetical protein RJ639_013546 [Escallonia herrerae]|uniref:Non-haem dioxygenase N-terminal domain-containing protein n=1 Tax=Escallonia herrerae TaxID=1293975 RepID=A0AA89AME2_9ASTE|nr:hypothetical protein RJ639_013546 [Escallonia herrerae]
MEVERVQALAHGNLHELPEKFIRLAHERPENTRAIEGVRVPVISLSLPHDNLVDEISKACSEWGFFLITDHGISTALIQRLREGEKERYANDPSTGKFEGYGTKLTKNAEAKLEWIDYYFHVILPASKVNYEIWPNTPPS